MWFMNDVWTKFQTKDTTFKQYEAELSELPTTVLCFQPIAKESVLKDFNISLYDLDNMLNLERFPKPWKNFFDKIHFKLNRDFTVALRDHEELVEGDNLILLEHSNMTITLNELFTVWYGFCYKISLSYIYQDQLIFTLTFLNDTLKEKDIPTPQLYITSEVNAYGALGMNWIYGDELRFSPTGYVSGFKITPIRRVNIDLKTHCTSNLTDHCLLKLIHQSDFACNRTCMPIKFPNQSLLSLPECNTIKEYNCMKWAMHRALFYDATTFCEKPCTTVKYKGKKAFGFEYYGTSRNMLEWRYILDSDKINVQEEYLVYDSTGFVGAIGGTLGLFVGFSFREVANFIIDSFELLVISIQNIN